MSDFPKAIDVTPSVISSFSFSSSGRFLAQSANTGQTAVAWPLANLALFVPFRVSQTIIAVKMFWFNGTAGTDSVDVGIYGQDGTRLVSSGSTLTSGASSKQEVDITDTTLTPGLYYMAMAMNGTTNTIVRFSAGLTGPLSGWGLYELTSAFALPATATFATTTRQDIPLVCLTQRTTV